MEKVRVDLQNISVSRLEMLELLRLRLVLVDGKTLVHVKVPDFFPGLSRIKSLILRVTHPAEFRIRRGRLRAVTLADELDDAFALVDLGAQHLAQIAAFGSENVLPDRFVTEEGERVGHKLPRAAQFFAHGGNENGRTRRHDGTKKSPNPKIQAPSKSQTSNQNAVPAELWLLGLGISLGFGAWDLGFLRPQSRQDSFDGGAIGFERSRQNKRFTEVHTILAAESARPDLTRIIGSMGEALRDAVADNKAGAFFVPRHVIRHWDY